MRGEAAGIPSNTTPTKQTATNHTTGRVGPKSKVNTPTHTIHTPSYPIPIPHQGPHIKILGPRGAHQTPQTTIHTSKTIHFSQAPLIVGDNWNRRPKIQSQTTHPPTLSLTRDPTSILWDNW